LPVVEEEEDTLHMQHLLVLQELEVVVTEKVLLVLVHY